MKPILFNTDMVRAILEGRKTVTRRVIKNAPENVCPGRCIMGAGLFDNETHRRVVAAPYNPGDILYIRETWASTPDLFDEFPQYIYRADFDERDLRLGEGNDETLTDFPACVKWRPSIHMPKEAARIFLRVKSVRVERLQDITYEDCKREGIWDDYKTHSPQYHENLARRAYPVVFAGLWDDTIKPADRATYGWEANPWVWVIEFERCERPKEA